jgi:hypothetical protein
MDYTGKFNTEDEQGPCSAVGTGAGKSAHAATGAGTREEARISRRALWSLALDAAKSTWAFDREHHLP